MASWIPILIIVSGVAVVGVGAAIWLGRMRWRESTTRLTDRLTRGHPSADGIFRRENLDDLPAPVARYFRFVLTDGQRLIRAVRVLHSGEFRVGLSDSGWRQFNSTQRFGARPPGFVWDARIRMAPFMPVRVRDAYVRGEASMHGTLMCLRTIIDEHGKAELNAGALQRYLAEAVWFPTALLPSQGVIWSEIDDETALATLSDFTTSVSLEFTFNAAGEVTDVFTPSRYREVEGHYERTPWAGHFRNYEERGSVRIPIEADVEWQLSDRHWPYWKGRVVDIEYDVGS